MRIAEIPQEFFSEIFLFLFRPVRRHVENSAESRKCACGVVSLEMRAATGRGGVRG
jgi:hypothetical protein